MGEQVKRRERIGSTPRMMTNNSSLGTINPIAVAEPPAFLTEESTFTE